MRDRLSEVLSTGRPALVLCEVQEGVLGDAAPWPELTRAADRIDLIGNVRRLAEHARWHGAPVIHCTADFLPGRFGANRNARLFGSARKRTQVEDRRFARPMAGTFMEGDIMLSRCHGISPMTGSALDSVLRNERVDTVIISGVSISFAVTNLVMDAVNHAYQVVLPRDAIAGFPEDYADQVVTHTLAMLATVKPTAAILAAWPQSGAPTDSADPR